MAKGFRWRRSSNYAAAKEALLKAGKYAYRDRRAKKRTRRSLWILNINNAARQNGATYKDLVKKMKDQKVALDRKVLCQLAVDNPSLFAKFIVELNK